MNNKITHLIKDSIHDSISFSKNTWKWAKPIINSYEFQRLTRVMQLGTTFKTFPSAVHTRYNHCLGAYEVARRILLTLSANDKTITEKEIQTVLAAALLHDIGHGPLSHSFESFYDGFDHEKIGIEIITNPNGIIYKSLKNANIEPWDVANLLSKKNTTHWMQAIISSQLDCDRLDYLLRDSKNTGVSYGYIDVSILLKWIKKIDDYLVYDIESVYWIENFLISRYHMFMQIYCNEHNLKNDSLVTLIFKRLRMLKNDPILKTIEPYFWNLYEPVIQHNLTLESFLKLDDYNLYGFITELQKVDDYQLKQLVNGYLFNRNYSVEILNNCKIHDNTMKINDDFNNYVQNYKIVTYKFDTDNEIKIYDNHTKTITNFSDCSKVFASEKICVINKVILNYKLKFNSQNKKEDEYE